MGHRNTGAAGHRHSRARRRLEHAMGSTVAIPAGFDPETNMDEVIFLPIYLSILTFENEEVP